MWIDSHAIRPVQGRHPEQAHTPPFEGVRILGPDPKGEREGLARLHAYLVGLGLRSEARPLDSSGHTDCARMVLRLEPEAFASLENDFSTLGLADRLGLDTVSRPLDLEREIVAALLMAPIGIVFPSFDEFESAVRIRCHLVQAARLTALDFDTEAIERPRECWGYSENTGFIVRPGHDLEDALRRATQPESADRRYAFSCYRATEYLMLLAIAQEASLSNPDLRRRMQKQAERRAIQSGEFHDVFLREYGSMSSPLPGAYFVPGDRVWFRNPDEHSADAEGYEGSWVIYLGGGLFSNFWQRERPYTLTRKCLEIFHWRHATWRDASGALKMDEDEVERRVAGSLADPEEQAAILHRMRRPRDPRGVYAQGGCLDTTREFARWIRPDTCDIALPDH